MFFLLFYRKVVSRLRTCVYLLLSGLGLHHLRRWLMLRHRRWWLLESRPCRHTSISLGLHDILLLACQVFLDVRTETCKQRVKTHLILIALKRVCVLTRIVLQRHEGLQQVGVLVCKLLAVRVLLNFALAGQSLPTAALEGVDLVAEQRGFLASSTLINL